MDAIFQQAARRFGTVPDECTPLRGGNFNRVYAFRREGRDCILRITPPSEEVNAASLRRGLEFMDHLARGGVPVPAPLRSVGGEWIEPLPVRDGLYLAAAFERAPGVLAEELPFEVWDAVRFQILGQAVGRFHACASSYPAEGPHWDRAVSCFNPAEILADELLRRRRVEAWRAVEDLPREAGSYGWIHADLHGGNFMLDPEENRITLLDFDDSALGWRVMDIAMLLHDFCVLAPDEPKEPFAARFLTAFLRGYLPEHPLGLEWFERLPLFLKLLETGIYAQVAPFAAEMEPNSWVGRFMLGRKERIASARPVLEMDFIAVRAAAGHSG